MDLEDGRATSADGLQCNVNSDVRAGLITSGSVGLTLTFQ